MKNKAMKISPESRRLVIQYAAKENLTFDVALECLIMEGVKALGAAGKSFPALISRA